MLIIIVFVEKLYIVEFREFVNLFLMMFVFFVSLVSILLCMLDIND